MGDDLLRAEPRAIEQLAASDRRAWQRLVAHAKASAACPPELTRALLALDDVDGWLGRLFRAYAGLSPDDRIEADQVFAPWLTAGIARTFPASDRRALEARYRDAWRNEGSDATDQARELVADVERAGIDRGLLGRARLLLARRWSEDLDHDAALAAARSAADLFAEIGDDALRTQAVRTCGAALLRARRIDEALAVLDTVGDAPSAWGATSHRNRPPARELDPVDHVLYHAGIVAASASSSDILWSSALRDVARATGHRGCALRAAPGGDPDDILLPRQLR